ncbi:CBS domain-containing protein [Candidatus Pacearchaeota archaeon]|nr:CBS domain-containing protein [Candidatus Pacearchaeota archaeon]
MVFDITHLKKIRRQLGLTQHQFAVRATISQSMVAKIESGKIDPTYSYVKKIEEALANLQEKHELNAKDIMSKKIIYTDAKEKIHNVIAIMQKHSISQIPVFEKNNIIGIISESSILKKNLEDIYDKLAKDVIEETPPIVSPQTKISVIKSLLQYYPCILVRERISFLGIITKSDLIKSLR